MGLDVGEDVVGSRVGAFVSPGCAHHATQRNTYARTWLSTWRILLAARSAKLCVERGVDKLTLLGVAVVGVADGVAVVGLAVGSADGVAVLGVAVDGVAVDGVAVVGVAVVGVAVDGVAVDGVAVVGVAVGAGVRVTV